MKTAKSFEAAELRAIINAQCKRMANDLMEYYFLPMIEDEKEHAFDLMALQLLFAKEALNVASRIHTELGIDEFKKMLQSAAQP